MTDPSRPPISARRAAIGFKNGADLLALRVSDEQLTALRSALKESRGGWLEVEATDGAVLVDLAEIAYLRVESGEHRVGF
jgi:hypothetical protein